MEARLKPRAARMDARVGATGAVGTTIDRVGATGADIWPRVKDGIRIEGTLNTAAWACEVTETGMLIPDVTTVDKR
jgi:hypothetical protein